MSQLTAFVADIQLKVADPVAVIDAGQITIKALPAEEPDHLEFLKEHIPGRMVGLIRLHKEIDMWHDDEFLYNEEPVNLAGTLITQLFGWPHRYAIQGSVVVAGHDGPDMAALTGFQLGCILDVFCAIGGSLEDVIMA